MKRNIINNFIMDYNQFTYYRAHPYANLGYMPPTALQNRHKPQFITQIPMGQQHLGKIGKKMFTTNIQKSNISTENILKSPERYPFQNRIALDKQYQRNLNTIDIEGASGGTLVSQAVRNKIKARQEIIRRQQQVSPNKSQLQPIVSPQTFQQQRRRKIAYQQYLKDQQLKQVNQNKSRIDNSSTQQKLKGSQRHSVNYGSNINNNNIQENIQNQYYLKNRKSKLDDYNQLIKPRYQSIDLSQLKNKNSENYDRYDTHAHNSNIGNNLNANAQMRRSYTNHLNDPRRPQATNGQLKRSQTNVYSQNKQAYIFPFADRKSLRLQNPTNLSSESSIHLAALNIMKNQ